LLHFLVHIVHKVNLNFHQLVVKTQWVVHLNH
jgi:hypothetical protein